MKKLNIGCGKDIKPKEEGWINIDQHDMYGVNMIHHLPDPLPFRENSIDLIYCSHVLEDFANIMPIMWEFWRVLKPTGLLHIKVPDGRNPNYVWGNPFHQRAFVKRTFYSFEPGIGSGHYGNLMPKFKVLFFRYNSLPRISFLVRRKMINSLRLDFSKKSHNFLMQLVKRFFPLREKFEIEVKMKPIKR